MPFHIGDKRITKAFIKGLDKKGIFYVKTDEDSLLIARTDEEETFSLLEGVARQFIRPYRNASFSPGGLEVAKEALDEKELKYEIVEVFGTETIIWGEEDNESIQSTLSELPIGRAEQLW